MDLFALFVLFPPPLLFVLFCARATFKENPFISLPKRKAEATKETSKEESREVSFLLLFGIHKGWASTFWLDPVKPVVMKTKCVFGLHIAPPKHMFSMYDGEPLLVEVKLMNVNRRRREFHFTLLFFERKKRTRRRRRREEKFSARLPI